MVYTLNLTATHAIVSKFKHYVLNNTNHNLKTEARKAASYKVPQPELNLKY